MPIIKCTENDGKQICVMSNPYDKEVSLPANFNIGTSTANVSMDYPISATENVPLLNVACRQDASVPLESNRYSCVAIEYKTEGPPKGGDRTVVGHRSVNENGETVMQITGTDHPLTLVFDQSQ